MAYCAWHANGSRYLVEFAYPYEQGLCNEHVLLSVSEFDQLMSQAGLASTSFWTLPQFDSVAASEYVAYGWFIIVSLGLFSWGLGQIVKLFFKRYY